MFYTPIGTIAFYNFQDLFVDYLCEMGLKAYNNYLCYQETKAPLQYKGKLIKVSTNGDPVYAGLNEIVYDPIRNYGITSTLFGLYLDQCQDPNNDDGDILQGYIAHYVEDDKEHTKQRVTVKTVGRGEISSNFYHNIFLAYFDCTFRISGHDNFSLEAFDIDYHALQNPTQ